MTQETKISEEENKAMTSMIYDIFDINDINNLYIKYNKYIIYNIYQQGKTYIPIPSTYGEKIRNFLYIFPKEDAETISNLLKIQYNAVFTALSRGIKDGLFIASGKEEQKKTYDLSKDQRKKLDFIVEENLKKRKEESKLREQADRLNQEQTEIIRKIRNAIEISKDFFKRENKIIEVDFMGFSELEPDVANLLLDEPERLISCFESAMEGYKVKIINLPKSQHFEVNKLRTRHLNKFISIDINVRQKSEIRPQVVNAKFECPNCGTIISVLQVEKKFREPSRCSCGRKGQFTLIHKEMVDACRLIVEDRAGISETSPSRINAFLQEELVNEDNSKKCEVGKEIRLNGILKEIPVPLQTGAISTRFDWALEVNSIESSEEDVSTSISEEDIEKIKKFCKEVETEKGFKKLISLIAPQIYKEDLTKEAVLCSALSCKNEFNPNGTIIRNSVHSLFIGDIAKAKTQIAQSIANVTPHSRYTEASRASQAGLCAAVVKDDFTGGWAVEGGTFVLCNNGLMIADEIDKVPQEEQLKWHEPLESQTISVDKATIKATLPANTAAILLANPANGVFDFNRPVVEQINIAPSLINRCDLTLVLKDIQNDEDDIAIADSILEREDNSVSEKPTEVSFLKKLIYYLKSQPAPKLTKEIRKTISPNYLEMRKRVSSSFSKGKINSRYVNSLKSLSKVYARMRLSPIVGEIDIERAKAILEKSFESLEILNPKVTEVKLT